jgi:hypothetical protein
MAAAIPAVVAAEGLGTAATGGMGAAATGGFNRLAGQVSLEVLAEILANQIPGAIGAVNQATAPKSAGFAPVGKYFLGPESAAAYEQLLLEQIPKRELYNFISNVFGRGDIFGELPSTDEFINKALERQLIQAQDLTRREIEKIRAEKEFDYMARAMEAQAGVRKQELSSLGDIQRQRVESGFDAAKNMFNEAIKTIYAKENLASSPVLQQLATAI